VLAIGAGVGWQWYHERGRGASLARVQPAPRVAARTAPARAPVAAPQKEKARPKVPEKLAEAAPPPPAVAKAQAGEAAVEKVASQPLPIAKVAPGLHRLVIRSEQEAWIEVRGDDERALISSLNPAGAERSLRARGPLNLVIGNARHVTVLHNDQPLDLAPYIKTETARFTLP
jgi:cytoskeleton protein RodZ